MGALSPLIISLIFQAIRIAAQVAGGNARANAALSELELFMVQLNQEGRDPTPEEMAIYTERTAEIDLEFQQLLDRLETAAGP